MNFIADLHLHSKYSIATARDLDLEHMYIAAQIKGIGVIGTGDFTHPAWFNEIETKLEPDGSGLYRLKAHIASACDARVPVSCRCEVRFILQTEISNIYKKDQKTRKNHNLVFMPNRRMARVFNDRLDRIGNIRSDGRPILGLDARNLLEIMLDVTEDSFLIPAHIWTPWFSVLGSKSGFDTLEECYEDLTKYIFAVETGLSSDPAMNWRISALDGLTLVSNSDAHSPSKLGREANRFKTDRSFDGIKSALQTGDPETFLGTFEYYPEEGKYHLDGHRKCNVRLTPSRTMAQSGQCHVCGKPVTLGVLHRVEELADRPKGAKPEKYHPYSHTLPLIDILSELLQKGPQTKAVVNTYNTLVTQLGPEFDILHRLPREKIARSGLPFLDEAIERMRLKEIVIQPGYDGEFGQLEIFKQGEREKLAAQRSLFQRGPAGPRADGTASDNGPTLSKKKEKNAANRSENRTAETVEAVENVVPPTTGHPIAWSLSQLNPEQRHAVEHVSGPLLVVAGPGTGKTRTLTYRIAHLIRERRVPATSILAVTFTHKAAREMQTRLAAMLGTDQPLPLTTTFHSFCLRLLTAATDRKSLTIIHEAEQRHYVQVARALAQKQGSTVSVGNGWLRDQIQKLKQRVVGPDDPWPDGYKKDEQAALAAVYSRYQYLLERHAHWDYEDLIMQSVKRLESDAQLRKAYRETYPYLFIDEYQDLNHGQYRLIKALSPDGRNLCVIGDPDQAIYGFRGSDRRYFSAFKKDYPDAVVLRLTQNYRSTQTILDASYQVIQKDRADAVQIRSYSHIDGIRTISVLRAPSAKSEAVAIGKTIERLVGGTGFHALDFDRVDGNAVTETFSFGDFAVLYRTRSQGDEIARVLERAGLPIQVANRRVTYQESPLAGLISLLKIIRQAGSYDDFRNVIHWMGSGIGEKAWQRFTTWGYENDLVLDEALFKVRRFPIPGMRRAQQSKIDGLIAQVQEVKSRCDALDIEASLRYILDRTLLGSHFQNDTGYPPGLSHVFDTARRHGLRTLDEWLAHLALEQDTDLYDAEAERVALMTLHAAKGLEFPVVFIVGCEDGYLPYRRSESDPVDIAEERRLFYVAMTRARAQLFLSWAQTRVLFGKKTRRSLSPFVFDIEEHLKAHASSGLKARRPTRPAQRQLELF